MALTPKPLGSYYGGNLGFLNYEIFNIQHFARADLKPEAGLMSVKWFDYRPLHPLQATYYFVKCYTEAYRDFTRRSVDAARAPYVRCFSDVDFLMAREKKVVLKLRQLVDRMGMRYDFFLGFAMSWYGRMEGADGQVYAPRPGHLLNNEELIADAMLAWEALCATTLQSAKDPFYRIANFRGHPDQIAHEAFIVASVKQRKHPQYVLNTALYGKDLIRIEEALRAFGKQAVADAIHDFEVS